MKTLEELKAGDACDYEVAGAKLCIEPVPYGRLKKLLRLVLGKINAVIRLDTKEIMEQVPNLFDENLPELVELMFDKKKHAFLNYAWVNDNITFIHMRDIYHRFVKVNGLQDFLGKKVETPKEPETRLMKEKEGV